MYEKRNKKRRKLHVRNVKKGYIDAYFLLNNLQQKDNLRDQDKTVQHSYVGETVTEANEVDRRNSVSYGDGDEPLGSVT
jgi:hypothetical protein